MSPKKNKNESNIYHSKNISKLSKKDKQIKKGQKSNFISNPKNTIKARVFLFHSLPQQTLLSPIHPYIPATSAADFNFPATINLLCELKKSVISNYAAR